MAAVDIIIPLYNKAKTVERTIRSIQQQTFTDWNLIVVDDGSTDDGPDRVRGMSDPRIRLISQPNQGPGAARNTGIHAAAADYVAFLDADDEWYPWYLENAVKAIENNPVSLVGSMYYTWPHEKDMTGYWAKQGVVPGVYFLEGNESSRFAESLMFFFHVWSSVVRRDKAMEYGGFYVGDKCLYAEDTVFFFRLVFNEPVMVIGPAAVRYNRQDSNLSHTLEHPEAPFFAKPGIILDYCSPKRRELARQVIHRVVLRTVHHLARNGYRKRAEDLLGRFPESKQFATYYYRCKAEIIVSPVLHIWVRFKCFIGFRLRVYLKQLLRK